ncbi:MAG: bacteriohemerythrin [Gammaproteobacteria bacterium]|nr:bacteriohemerythrin [Gammaproteobacteria bacterium]
MAYWNWDSSLSVGISLIDKQHQRIITYLNELSIAHIDKNSKKVSEVLVELVDYTVTHFSFEEDLMSQAGYPISTAHKQVHESFIGRIKNYQDQHNQGKNITRKLMSELQLWLTNHIKHEDKKYVPYVNKFINKEQSWISQKLKDFFGHDNDNK